MQAVTFLADGVVNILCPFDVRADFGCKIKVGSHLCKRCKHHVRIVGNAVSKVVKCNFEAGK